LSHYDHLPDIKVKPLHFCRTDVQINVTERKETYNLKVPI